MKKILFIISALILTISCEEEVIQFDPINGQSLIQFDKNLTNVEIDIGKETTVEIPINVSTRSEVNRTIRVEVADLNSLNPERFSFNENIIIPANQFRGVLTITIKDSGINDNPDETLSLRVTEANFDNFTIANSIHTININQNCPIPNDFFTGTYLLYSPLTQGNAFCSAPRPTIIGNNIEVEVNVGKESNQRVFKARYAPGSCDNFSSINDFILELSCNTIQLSNQINTSVIFNGNSNKIGKDSKNISNYSISDDSILSFNIINDINNVTNVGSTENQTIILAKKCDIPNNFFTGTYILDSPIANVWCNAPRPSIIGNNTRVEFILGDQSNTRVLKARYAPGSCDAFSSINDFELSLSCNNIVLNNQVGTGISCGGNQSIISRDPNNISSFSLTDDSNISFTIIDDLNGACTGGPFENQTITLTKCPTIPNNFFTGTYILNSPQANIWCAAPRHSLLGNNLEVEVTIGAQPNLRVFSARYAPGSCDTFSTINDFVLDISCNEVRLDNQLNTGVSCTNGNNIIIINDFNNVTSYSIDDDRRLSFNIIDDITASCASNGAPFNNQTITLTKK